MQFRGMIARAMLGALLVAGAGAGHSASVRAEIRTLSMYEIHRKDTITVTFKRNGVYDEDGLKKINHFMRDWRTDGVKKMDRELIDLIWALHTSLGSQKPIHLISAYRSAATNAKLRRRGGGQARKSKHILGQAADIHFPDVPVKKLRASAMIREVGGVGYYPTSGIPFVHVDTGNVRSWPRMPRLELAALFPSGKTAHLPSDGRRITKKDHQRAAAKGMVNHTLIASATGTPVAPPAPAPVPVPEVPASNVPVPGVPAPGVPADVIAAYTPPDLSATAATAPKVASLPAQNLPATQNFPAPMALGPANDPEPQRFALASAGPGLPFARASLRPDPAQPVKPPVAAQPGIPAYQSATVVTAPDVDDDHPDALSYMPFETASLMTDTSVARSAEITPLVHPEQHNLDHHFDDMDSPTAFEFRPTSGYRGLANVQQFSGAAVKSLYAEMARKGPTRLARAR